MEGSRKRARRLLVVTATLAALATLTVASSGVAADNPVAVPDGETRTSYVPLGLRTEPATVIVQFTGSPVAISGAGKSKREKNKLAAELMAKQNSLQPSIEALGAQVISSFQWAYNGMKVRIPRSKLAALDKLSGVNRIHPAELFERTHLNSVPLVNAPAAWNGAGGKTGSGVKIAILDTGIDYTHANFDGPGTAEAFAAADASDTVEASPTLFGPLAPRIKGGIDLVGDDYDASADADEEPEKLIPHPDPNPLDCNGHGSHVAGSAGGSGVLADGSTYTGSYGADTFSTAFRIGPGVAPEADLYAVRVFGCLGSTNVVVEALDWAVQNGMDVVNMSLGLTFGIPDSNPSAEAANNAAKAGVVVVASAGNSGPSQYIGGTPGTALRTISVAANDSVPTQPGASLDIGIAPAIQAINANGATFTDGTVLPIKVLKNANGTMKRGCNHPDAPEDLRDANDDPAVNDYVDVAGKVVVVQRGTCARIARAIYGQKEGAAAVIMVNNSTALPPFEGPITSNPDTGDPFNVTIPFLGVRGLAATAGTDGNRLAAADGGSMTLTNINLTNTGYKGFASFTSGGPRQGDSILKPDVTAPGVSILSTGVGTGNRGAFVSGTSMASPHVAGLAALVQQAHPAWSVEEVKAAVVSTADPAGVVGAAAPGPGYRTSRGGAGFVNANAAANTNVTAFGDDFTSSLSFGFAEVDKDVVYERQKQIKLRNYSSQPITFDVAAVIPQGSPHSVQLSRTQVTVPENGGDNVDVRLVVPSATIGSSSAYREVAGLVKFTPTEGGNGGFALHVPYLLVPRPVSYVDVKLEKNDLKSDEPSTTATVSNIDGTIGSSADFYAWGLEDGSDGLRFNDVRAVGVQAFNSPTAADPGRRLMFFAVNMWRPWSHASVNEVDIFIDVNRDGTDDYAVVMADLGLLTTGSFDGTPAVAVFNLHNDEVPASIAFLASAPTDSATMLLPVRIGSSNAAARQLCTAGAPCLSADNPRFDYRVETFGLRLAEDDVVSGTAAFNAWSSSISQGMFETLAPNETKTVPVTVDVAEWALTPAKGVMVVSRDNRNGEHEARTAEVKSSG
jgi:minor extracellular serine protease Vpr